MTKEQKPMTPREFVTFLVDTVGIRRYRDITGWEQFQLTFLDMSPPLRLKLSRLVPVLFSERTYLDGRLSERETNELKSKLREYIRETGNDFCVCVIGGVVDEDSKRLSADSIPENFAIIDGEAILAIVGEKNKQERQHLLGRTFASQVGVMRISPYDADEPAVRGRFFGRTQTLREILSGGEGKSYTVIGPRRIGKTSLLGELKDRLTSTFAESKVLRVANLVATRYESTEQIIAEIVAQLLERGGSKEAYKEATRKGRVASKFKYLIRDLADKKHRVAVFIDEVDYILELDAKQGYECIALLHSAFDQVPRAQLFLAGFRQTFRARHDINTPLYGFTETKELGPLLPAEAREMIIRPFADLGVPVEDAMVERMTGESAGHPQVITYFCEAYLKYYDRHQKKPDDAYFMEEVLGSAEFRRRLTGAFFANTNPSEELFCLLLMKKALQSKEGVGGFEFSLRIVDGLLKEKRVHLSAPAIKAICENLRLCSIIHEIKGTELFRFYIPQLVKFFRISDLEWHVQKAVHDVNEQKADPRRLYEGRESGSTVFTQLAERTKGGLL